MDQLSLVVLALVILVSFSQRINIGLLSLVMAWIVGHLLGRLEVSEVLKGFPVSLLVMLVSVSYFFGLAENNGTLGRVTHFLIQFTRGRAALLPLVFFVIAVVLSTFGAGNIGAVALLAPVAMPIAERTKLGPFFMSVMVVTGANAGAFSPFAMTGIIADELIKDLGLTMGPWTQIYWPAFLMQAFIALCSYFAFMSFHRRRNNLAKKFSSEDILSPGQKVSRQQRITFAAIAVLIIGVVFFKAEVGFLALMLGLGLTVVGAGKTEETLAKVPWGIIVMVCGVSTLIAVVGKMGGTNILIAWLADISDPRNVTAVIALVTGILSTYSSSSAVIMPTFIPLVPGLIAKMGGGDPVAIVSAINVGSHVVDVSPLSTLGALCIASVSAAYDKHRLFRQLLVYGLSMSLAGAVVCYLFFGILSQS